MLVDMISTVLNNLWYEIWSEPDGGRDVFKAFRYDAELGTLHTVAVEWERDHAERMVRYDMANLGIA